jgi:hypothetical protein
MLSFMFEIFMKYHLRYHLQLYYVYGQKLCQCNQAFTRTRKKVAVFPDCGVPGARFPAVLWRRIGARPDLDPGSVSTGLSRKLYNFFGLYLLSCVVI